MDRKWICGIFILTLSIQLVACGGGSSSGGASGENPDPQPTVLEGVFVDSPVMGLAYRTATRSGITNSTGTFQYLAGETVSFSLGGIEFGSALGSNQLTPFSLLGLTGFAEANPIQRRKLTNTLIFLQSLDADDNPANGLDMAGLNQQLMSERLDFDMDTELFRTGRFARLVAVSGGRIVEEGAAVSHFLESLGTTIVLEQPVLHQIDADADGIYDIETVFEYDSKGLPKKKVTTKTEPYQVIEDILEYDENNRLIQATFGQPVIGGDTSNFSALRTALFAYTDSGRLARELYTLGANDSVERRNFYDEFDRIHRVELDTLAYSLPDRERLSRYGAIQASPVPYLETLFQSGQTVVGKYYESAQLRYADEGYAEQAEYRKVFVLNNTTEEILVQDEVRQYDSSGRLIAALGNVYDEAGGAKQVETNYRFLASGFLESCDVRSDGLLIMVFTQFPGSDSEAVDQFSYSGRCGALNQKYLILKPSGLPESIEQRLLIESPLSGVPYSLDIPQIRIAYIYDADSLVEENTYIGEEDALISKVEYSAGNLNFSGFGSAGELAFRAKTTTQTFEYDFLPLIPQGSTNSGVIFNGIDILR